MTDLIVSTLFSLVEKNAIRSQLGLGNDSNFSSVRVSIVFGKECLVRSLLIIRSAYNLVWSHDYSCSLCSIPSFNERFKFSI